MVALAPVALTRGVSTEGNSLVVQVLQQLQQGLMAMQFNLAGMAHQQGPAAAAAAGSSWGSMLGAHGPGVALPRALLAQTSTVWARQQDTLLLLLQQLVVA